MTVPETNSRQRGGLGLLAVVGLAALLLPLVPTWAQQSTKGRTQQQVQETKGPAVQLPKDLDKARKDVEKAAAELAQMQQMLQMLRDQTHVKEQQLKQAQQQLEQQLRDDPRVKAVVRANMLKLYGIESTGKDGTDKRLADLEKKLDAVLQELREIRKSMGRNPGQPVPVPPGGKPKEANKGQRGPAVLSAALNPGQVVTIRAPEGVEVRSGPSNDFYPTSTLRFGDTVKVIARTEKPSEGWVAIEPPAGSLSWINAAHVQRSKDNPNLGVVFCDPEKTVPIKPASTISDKEPNVEMVRLTRVTGVVIVGPELYQANAAWLLIEPPAGDVRFIPISAVNP